MKIVYRVSLVDAASHYLDVTTTVESAGKDLPSELSFFMPVWTPGSYLVREYARHVESVTVLTDVGVAGLSKVAKNRWSVTLDGARTVTVRYRLYCNELTVRTNHVDGTHAFWNGASTYLTPEGPLESLHVEVMAPEGWTVRTPLQRASPTSEACERFVAANLDELFDSPFECGNSLEHTAWVCNKQHRHVIWNNPHARWVDWPRVLEDSRTLIETEARLVHGEAKLPLDRYTFFWHFAPKGRGGLEHRESSTLLVSPHLFDSRSGYLEVLSLIAHEYFHLWNVKRIRPAGLSPYRYEEENHTRLLWWFEGATSYYDWRVLRLANLATTAEYLRHLGEEIVRLQDTPGASVHSAEDASYDAWIKAYRPDENTINSTVSYYLKGEVVCALLDLQIRHRSQGRASLDDVVRHLFREFGEHERPVPEDGMAQVIQAATGVSVDDCLPRYVNGTEPLPIDEVLAHAGLILRRSARKESPPCSLGIRTSVEHGCTRIDAVLRDRASHRAGLSPRDELLAVAGIRVAEGKVDACLARLQPGARVPVLIARDGLVQSIDVELDPPVLSDVRLSPHPQASSAQKALFEGWMEDPFPSID